MATIIDRTLQVNETKQPVVKGTCPCCGSNQIRRIRRITGYFSTVDRFNEGKKAELRDRVAHL